jgi:hypothetical protein
MFIGTSSGPEGRDMPKRKLELLAASNNFLEVGYNQME